MAESGQQSKKKAYYKNTQFANEREWKTTYELRHKPILMLQSCLRVSYTSPKIMHWITDLLRWLYDKGSEITETEPFLEKYIARAVKENYLIKEDFNMGVETQHIVFNYLDYLLWKENKKKYDDFSFEYRNSVEHWYPQHPSEGTFESWSHDEGLDHFGNLCLVQRKTNSKFSNLSPISKKGSFKDTIENGSIKLRIMSKLTTDNREWKTVIFKKHGEEMSDSNITTSDIHETIDQEISNLLTDNKEYRVQDHLYQNNEVYQFALHNACYDAFMNEEFDPKQPWFMDHSIERKNYVLFEKIANPLLTNSAYYMKYGTPNYMDLNIEIIGDDRLAMAHNYVLNGDVMADPDVEFTVDKKNRMLYPQTYQQDSLQYFERVDGDSIRARELNHFMHEWLTNVVDQKYKVQTIYTEDKELSVKENPNAVRSFCKQNGIGMMAHKLKELEK